MKNLGMRKRNSFLLLLLLMGINNAVRAAEAPGRVDVLEKAQAREAAATKAYLEARAKESKNYETIPGGPWGRAALWVEADSLQDERRRAGNELIAARKALEAAKKVG